MTPVLQATGVVKRFGGLNAVDHVDISIEPGEMVGLIGPNGSGKTTLFDCLSRVQSVNEGQIWLNGKDITRLSPHRVCQLGLARTFQLIRVYRELTVLENMELSLQWRDVSFIDQFRKPSPATRAKADQLIDLLLLKRLRDERAGSLSGGQRRLLELGMALMSDPSIVLLDEATSGVNPTLIEQIKDRIRLLNSEHGVAFLLVEHNIRFVSDLCDRVVVLNYGAKLAEGTPEAIMENEDVIEAYFGDDGSD
ncbi:MAG: ABC transporter ATP-binding protein [Acidimicrobiia bacterium]|nr:ABC transporter ATP-binding protein [Acidimicrobiia bacterium]